MGVECVLGTSAEIRDKDFHFPREKDNINYQLLFQKTPLLIEVIGIYTKLLNLVSLQFYSEL